MSLALIIFNTVIVMCFKQSNPIQMSWLEILAVFYFLGTVGRDTFLIEQLLTLMDVWLPKLGFKQTDPI